MILKLIDKVDDIGMMGLKGDIGDKGDSGSLGVPELDVNNITFVVCSPKSLNFNFNYSILRSIKSLAEKVKIEIRTFLKMF